jgi:hypothetical protein
VTLIPSNTQRSNSFSSDTLDTPNEESSDPSTTVECLSNTSSFNPAMVVVTSPSFNSDLSSEQNGSNNQLFLDAKHHRRNKSEPFKSASTENLSSTNDDNDSSLSYNPKDEIRRKSSTKIKLIIQEKSPSSSTTTARKKKAWYNVIVSMIY